MRDIFMARPIPNEGEHLIYSVKDLTADKGPEFEIATNLLNDSSVCILEEDSIKGLAKKCVKYDARVREALKKGKFKSITNYIESDISYSSIEPSQLVEFWREHDSALREYGKGQALKFGSKILMNPVGGKY